MASERLESVDAAKGIAIICVVVSHIGIFSPSGAELTMPWTYQFHMPVFFVIAGYFLGSKLSVGAFTVQKLKRLMLPYAATALAVVGVTALEQACGSGCAWPGCFATVQDALLAALYGSGSWYNPVPAGIAPIGAIWFLPALCLALVECRICLKWRHGWLASLPLAAAALLTARVFWLPMSVQSGLVAALFVMFGHWLRGRDFLVKPHNWLALLTCTCVFIVAGVYNLKLSLASLLTAGNMLVALVVGASGSVLCLELARLCSEHVAPVTGFLAFFGKGSLTVLCVHLLLIDAGLNTLLAAATGAGGNVLSLLLIAVHLALAAACIPLFRKTPGLRKLWP